MVTFAATQDAGTLDGGGGDADASDGDTDASEGSAGASDDGGQADAGTDPGVVLHT